MAASYGGCCSVLAVGSVSHACSHGSMPTLLEPPKSNDAHHALATPAPCPPPHPQATTSRAPPPTRARRCSGERDAASAAEGRAACPALLLPSPVALPHEPLWYSPRLPPSTHPPVLMHPPCASQAVLRLPGRGEGAGWCCHVAGPRGRFPGLVHRGRPAGETLGGRDCFYCERVVSLLL